MPIYEYECPRCGVFDVMQKITEKPLRKCPTCKAKVTKLLSNTSFQLKGTGWYVTDYARKGGDGAKRDGAKEAGASDAKAAPDKKGEGTKGEGTKSGGKAAGKGSTDAGKAASGGNQKPAA